MKRKRPALPRFNERPALLSARRNSKMARSVHAYVRGSTASFTNGSRRPTINLYLAAQRYGSAEIVTLAIWDRSQMRRAVSISRSVILIRR
jgi:hypothetical protein